jgi:hypothetical protein
MAWSSRKLGRIAATIGVKGESREWKKVNCIPEIEVPFSFTVRKVDRHS